MFDWEKINISTLSAVVVTSVSHDPRTAGERIQYLKLSRKRCYCFVMDFLRSKARSVWVTVMKCVGREEQTQPAGKRLKC